MIGAAVMSSARHDWRTPEVILDAVRAVAPIGLDPCTATDNPTCAASFYTECGDPDGMSGPWAGHGLAYVNPPYGRAVGRWLARCPEADSCVALPAARTDTQWFHASTTTADVACFLKGRLRFSGSSQGAPFPSVAIGWAPVGRVERRQWIARFAAAFGPLGLVVTL